MKALCIKIIIHGRLGKVGKETISWSNTKLPFHASNPTLLCSGCGECEIPTSWLFLSNTLAIFHAEFFVMDGAMQSWPVALLMREKLPGLLPPKQTPRSIRQCTVTQ